MSNYTDADVQRIAGVLAKSIGHGMTEKCETHARAVLEALAQPAQGEAVAPRFPAMLRKMWSGSEVQEWINEHWTTPPATVLKAEHEALKARVRELEMAIEYARETYIAMTNNVAEDIAGIVYCARPRDMERFDELFLIQTKMARTGGIPECIEGTHLLPCPLCYSDNVEHVIFRDRGNHNAVRCIDCGCQVQSQFGGCVEKWNFRSSFSTNPADEVK